MTNNKKIYSLLGLATKAGSITSGEFLTEKAVKSKKAYLVIIANDASDNTKDKFIQICKTNNISLYFFGEKELLGKAVGKPFRASIALLDKGLGEAISKQLNSLK